MRICFVTTNFPRYVNDGEGTFVWESARAVAHLGHQVKVVAQHWPGLPTHEWMENVEVFRPRYWWPESAEMLRQPGGGLPIVWRHSRLARIQILPFIIVHSLTVAQQARDCDVIHAQWSLSAAAACLSYPWHQRPIVATLHGSDIFQVTTTYWGGWLTRLILQRCDRITVVSRALANAIEAIGLSNVAITIIPNGVDLAQFTPRYSTRAPLIVYVGSLIPRKGVIYLIQAMARLMPTHPSLHLVIVGDGIEKTSLREAVCRLGIATQVSFVGEASREQVRSWMQQAKVFVLPSTEEGFGVVLLEALACATPIVASQVGGICDVVTPEVGILVPPRDPDALAAAIAQLVDDEKRWLECSLNARKRAEESYDWHRIALCYQELYQDLLSQNKHSFMKRA
jgi:glycosyltransferase involved in cell wall biosynthesis